MAAAVIPPPGIHGNITAAFFPSVASSHSAAVFSSPPAAAAASVRRTVTPAVPVAIPPAPAPVPAVSQDASTKKAAKKRPFNEKDRENQKRPFKARSGLSIAINVVKKAFFDEMEKHVGNDFKNNPRFD